MTRARVGIGGVRALLVSLGLVALSGCAIPSATGTTPMPVDERVPVGTLDMAAARTALDGLTVAVPGRMGGYERDCDKGAQCVFGRPWQDTDGDGCDQRSQVLARDLVDVERKPGRCAVTAGTLHDPYTGKTVDRAKVQIEHVVPLAEMWRSGAAKWPIADRVTAANDLGNLIAVDGKTNQSRGDKIPGGIGAQHWLPPNTGYHCSFARIYATVKGRYKLTVTAPERAELIKALETCPA
ncbi:HNH endonuclease family protein [Alloactinosynnema sp. L-07]|uniref:HNH endonuclease family protein n=1 Tax=Alloactinosynnema sp. L-07 TaxID=1653480 RepID=UPI0018D478E3|nr:HNH endonuclease family protein [Alloactinosynnema sp. L-07]